MDDDAARVHGTRWDVFCRVVDNLGDAGVCWRLVRQLSVEHGVQVRLWIDAPHALERLVPGARPGGTIDGVRIERWDDTDRRLHATPRSEVPDVVVGAFACTLPDAYRRAMHTRRPVWIDLEYLSAEDWVASHHGLSSPKPDGLVEHFFFPGFGTDTGGLLRESDLIAHRDAFAADPVARTAFLASIGVDARPGERLASLFCYPDAPVRVLLDALGARPEPWRVLVPDGVAPAAAGHPLAVVVPFVPQRDYDRLLWSCALNFVRGEDSLVRALWSGRPFVWQPYRQDADAHLPKLRAFVARWCEHAEPTAAAGAAFDALHAGWSRGTSTAWTAPMNRLPSTASPLPTLTATDPAALPACVDAFVAQLPALQDAAGRWVRRMAAEPDLAARLSAFVGRRL